MSGVTYHGSGVRCQLFFGGVGGTVGGWDKVVELVGGGSVINQAYPSSLNKIS